MPVFTVGSCISSLSSLIREPALTLRLLLISCGKAFVQLSTLHAHLRSMHRTTPSEALGTGGRGRAATAKRKRSASARKSEDEDLSGDESDRENEQPKPSKTAGARTKRIKLEPPSADSSQTPQSKNSSGAALQPSSDGGAASNSTAGGTNRLKRQRTEKAPAKLISDATGKKSDGMRLFVGFISVLPLTRFRWFD